METNPNTENPLEFLKKKPSSSLGLGTWVFGGDYWGEASLRDSRKVIRTALEGGIRDFDTAPAYGNGLAEQILGQSLRTVREQTIISSKFFPTLPQNVRKGLNRSLRRLLTSRLDICYLHWPNEKCDIRGIMEELEAVRAEGIIRAVGVSNFSPEQMETLGRWGKIDICQTAYSLLWRIPEEELFPYCREKGIAVDAYSPLAQGLTAAGNRLPDHFSDGRAGLVLLHPSLGAEREAFYKEFSRAAEKGKTRPVRAALRWVLEQPDIRTVFAGARTQSQMRENLEAASVPLPLKLKDELQELSTDFYKHFKRIFPGVTNMWNHRRG